MTDDLWTRATTLGTPEQVEQLRRALEVASGGALVVPTVATSTVDVVRADERPLDRADYAALAAALARITGAQTRVVGHVIVTTLRVGGDRAKAAIERAARRTRIPADAAAVIRVIHPRPHGGRRPGAGRPPSADAATARLEVRLTPGELEELRARADEAGQAVSEYVRDALFLAPSGKSQKST